MEKIKINWIDLIEGFKSYSTDSEAVEYTSEYLEPLGVNIDTINKICFKLLEKRGL